MLLQLRDVSADGSPAADLPLIVADPPAAVIPAVPLEPTPRILVIDPAVGLPDGQRLRGVDAEAVQLRVVPLGAQLRFIKPIGRKLFGAVGHVLPAENAQLKQLLRRE